MQKIINISFLLILCLPMTLFAQNNLANQSSKQAIYTENAPAPIGIYSQAVKVDHATYISGQIPLDKKTGELVKGNFSEQAKQAFTNLNEIAKASGASLNDVVKLTVFVTDLGNFAAFNNVMKEFFHEPYPARSVVEVKALPKNAPVEIEAILIH